MGGILPTVRQQKSSKSGRIPFMLQERIKQYKPTGEEKVTTLEGHARALSETIVTFQPQSDPNMFSFLLSNFLHTASKLRKARMRV